MSSFISAQTPLAEASVHACREAASQARGGGRPAKLAERVAAAMQQDIASLGWPVGLVLGSEAQLMERYRISRATLREAIRQLERHGVASMRRGAGGGLVVRQPASDSAALALATYLELTDVSFAELFEARELVECLVVETAARQLADSDIAQARELIELLLHTPPSPFNEELRLHGRIREFLCAVAGNPAISLIYITLCYVTINGHTPRDAQARASLEQTFRNGRELKRHLLEAIVAGDAQKAQERVRESLRQIRQLIEELRGSLRQGPTSRMSSLESAPDFAIRQVYDKSAHRLAVVIARAIANSGLRAGAHLGAEPELQAIHGVSRAVLREALRTLELHAILRSRRGQGGGLIVETPDPSYTIRLAIDYLRHSQLPRYYFYQVWKPLQLAAASLAAQHLEPGGRVRLQQVLLRAQGAGPAECLAGTRQLDLAIAELSGNRALALFSHVLGALAESYPSGPPPDSVADKLRDCQAQLVQAILARDPSLARRGMLRYFQLIEGWFGETPLDGWAE
ncbi:GntR family transcriptional regulator [Pseudomonas sp. R-28-1W-6]|uniref:FadR/GntR family transcriptional regulator n=1 Tax=Pseudomonas sp. R-28-1W-6 TaxID=2650101 RepID=UPI0013667B38|nr:FCD domain-containing protein [Pseudomonas sp. R-28-1W-6]MWV10719.1 GntR family transcriptional regulator [Pseudomonas sp. R-28-1W-6]